ncbi:protein GVQW3-like [Palaemon carinicauda]|uniref:protein GVQW3-like n=1 Tax=Palaemon carinicauda TaxID=392227 RepID=UPI0035B696CB
MKCPKLEWRTNVKFLTKLWESKQILEDLNTVYGNNGPKKCAVYKCIKRLRESSIECENDHRSGRPSISITEERVTAVRSLSQENRRVTIDYIANGMSVSRESANSILVDDRFKQAVIKMGAESVATTTHRLESRSFYKHFE